MGITAFPFTAVIDVPAARILGRDDAGTGSAEALTNTEIFAILGTGTPSASTYLRGDGTWSTVSAGVGGSTGSVDNAVLRADGTGGATLQASAVVIPDNFTASPNATVNHASIQATGATTNVSLSIVPKGTGAITLAVPDGTATGGNAPGTDAINFQRSRTAAAQVPSGQLAAQFGGAENTASSTRSVNIGGRANAATNADAITVGGVAGTASGNRAITLGGVYPQATAENSATIGGYDPRATAEDSVVIGGFETTCAAVRGIAHGRQASGRLTSSRTFSGGQFAAKGDCQAFEVTLRGKTTTDAAVSLLIGGADRVTVPSGKILALTLQILGSKSDGTAVADYLRQVCIKNVGGTTSLVGTVNTIGTDEAAGTSIAITADDTNDALQINVTGVLNETWRWVAVVYGVELAYGT